ncbi:MAG: hypothetical protein KIS73_05540 [Enhydrobacter sp.]|nr:hypothetical protein [Enhydrobacter sp.]
MRTQPTSPAALGRQLDEWRLPLESDPAVDAAVVRMLNAIDRHLQRRQEAQERKN